MDGSLFLVQFGPNSTPDPRWLVRIIRTRHHQGNDNVLTDATGPELGTPDDPGRPITPGGSALIEHPQLNDPSGNPHPQASATPLRSAALDGSLTPTEQKE